MSTERQLPSSLARSISAMADPNWSSEQDALAKIHELGASLTKSTNMSEALKIANAVVALTKAKISRKNRISTSSKANHKFKMATGIDPVKFYAMTLIYNDMLGGYRQMANAREIALLVQRPDLFLRRGIWDRIADAPTHVRPMLNPLKGGERKELRDDLVIKMKTLVEGKGRALSPIFEAVLADFEKVPFKQTSRERE